MTVKNSLSGGESTRIRLLSESVSRRIAAGEVIDRPYSVVRELLDNALDASATAISLHLDAGGIGKIVCSDNGTGMESEDLKLCFLPHATSKITDVEDLYSLETMGFRGEALSSLAACSRLEILSRPAGSTRGNRLKVLSGKIVSLGEDRAAPGTTVTVEDLFYSLPGRKKFLKSPGAEGNLCKTAFLEKALPFPEIEFRFFSDGVMKNYLSAGTLKERVVQAFPRVLDASLIHQWEGEKDELGYSMVASGPSLYRRDRRYIQIYINNRRITEYSLIQAVEYGFRDILPGGCFPYAFVFLRVPPDKVDFNIHPSKKEVRFRDLPGIHHQLVQGIHENLESFAKNSLTYTDRSGNQGHFFQEKEGFLSPSQNTPPPSAREDEVYRSIRDSRHNSFDHAHPGDRVSFPLHRKAELSPLPGSSELRPEQDRESITDRSPQENFRYLGQVLDLFLVAQKDDTVYLIDQHAAHERILYDEAEKLWSRPQELLVPYVLELSPDQEKSLTTARDEYEKLGFLFQKEEEGLWQITAMPSLCEGFEEETVTHILESGGNWRELKKKLHATVACKKAIKDGTVLDDITARSLVEKAFALQVPRCPHGRPVWFTLSRSELYRLVGRDF
jgi:DNA mismatch repair protein MutL